MNQSDVLEQAKQLRNDPKVHYNCAQAVFLPFARRQGLTDEAALAITANFGAGMRAGLTCGAITGGLMALGLCGAGDPTDAQEFLRKMRANHEGMSACSELLAANAKTGRPKKAHCDDMVYEAVELVDAMLRERGA